MLEELRLYPRPPATRTGGRMAGARAAGDPAMAGHSLSTGYADHLRLGCTDARSPIHSDPPRKGVVD